MANSVNTSIGKNPKGAKGHKMLTDPTLQSKNSYNPTSQDKGKQKSAGARYVGYFVLTIVGALLIFLICIGIKSIFFGSPDNTSSFSSQVTNITTGAKVKILVNGKETWVVPGDQITIDLETSRPKDFTLVTNLPGPGGSNDHYFKWDHDPEIILENGDGVKRKGNETFPASWGNVKYRVHSTVKDKKATFRLFKMER